LKIGLDPTIAFVAMLSPGRTPAESKQSQPRARPALLLAETRACARRPEQAPTQRVALGSVVTPAMGVARSESERNLRSTRRAEPTPAEDPWSDCEAISAVSCMTRSSSAST